MLKTIFDAAKKQIGGLAKRKSRIASAKICATDMPDGERAPCHRILLTRLGSTRCFGGQFFGDDPR